MNSRLKGTRAWETLARKSRYSVASLAERCGLSARQVRRLAHQAFGQPPHEWLHALRLGRALELLNEGKSAKETSLLLGYKDPAHFSHDFKKQFGVSPNQWALQSLVPLVFGKMSAFDNKRPILTTEFASNRGRKGF